MHPHRVAKTDFQTPMDNFHYTIMSLGLKNAGATYQRVINAIFHDMLHDFVKHYLDDIVMKPKEVYNHVNYPKKDFERCRQYNFINKSFNI